MSKKYSLIFPLGDGHYEYRKDARLDKILKSARTDKGLSLRELATRVGCSHVYLHHIEEGARVPSLGLLDAIQQELGLKPFYIVPDTALNSFHLETALDGTVDAPSTEVLVFIILEALRRGGFSTATPKDVTRAQKKDGALAVITPAIGCPIDIIVKQR